MTRIYTIALISLLILLASCSSQAAPAATATSTLTPTSLLPTHSYNLPTAPAAMMTSAAATQNAAVNVSDESLDPEAVERGQGRYEALECGSCHGDNGEGTSDGPALVDTSLTQGEFISFLRSGGTIGNDHLYSTNRLSESGGRNLYVYILSLSAE